MDFDSASYRSRLTSQLSQDLHRPTTLYGVDSLNNPYLPSYGFDSVAASQQWSKGKTMLKPLLVLLFLAGIIYLVYWWLYKYPIQSNQSLLADDPSSKGADATQSNLSDAQGLVSSSTSPLGVPLSNPSMADVNLAHVAPHIKPTMAIPLSPIPEEEVVSMRNSSESDYDQLDIEKQVDVMRKVIQKCFDELQDQKQKISTLEQHRQQHIRRRTRPIPMRRHGP